MRETPRVGSGGAPAWEIRAAAASADARAAAMEGFAESASLRRLSSEASWARRAPGVRVATATAASVMWATRNMDVSSRTVVRGPMPAGIGEPDAADHERIRQSLRATDALVASKGGPTRRFGRDGRPASPDGSESGPGRAAERVRRVQRGEIAAGAELHHETGAGRAELTRRGGRDDRD